MAEMGWDEVTVIRKRAPKASAMKSQQAVNVAQRQGVPIDTQKKCKFYKIHSNKQHSVDKNTAKLDAETEELHHATVGLDVGRIIMQARQAKNMTQKDLATKINEKQQVVNEYEQAKAIPNQAVLAKMERILGVKLRGKDKGKPFIDKHEKKDAPAAKGGKKK
ncbi:PREDICTED: endothelial differentiation-related factor 1-like [Priapulus caudatus]|uniref:Endothelial differentiation-related factor 1-like n=1 Tax=Priapulus caudatus TaxID=37621 RepID=A0ABM1DY08_PRICU|nr:PREDICTED: endothelial differentiation-related factor 1-like [Priapulus caudatus]